METVHPNITQAIKKITELGFPKPQQNGRFALCLLALLNIGPDQSWEDAEQRLIGITTIKEFSKQAYEREYKPN